MTVLVRAPTRDDVAAMVELRAEVAAELKWIGALPGEDPDTVRARFERAMESETAGVFVAELYSRIEGLISIERAPYGVAELGMYVSESARGQGLGRALVAEAIEWARTHEAHKVSLEVWPHNVAAIALYEQFGFVEEGRRRRHYRRRGGGGAWDSLLMGLLLDQDIPGSPYGD